MYSKEQLSEVMKAAWSLFRGGRQPSFAVALKRAWQKSKTLWGYQARFDALSSEQKAVVAALIQAYEDAVYLPAHMSMSRRRQEISRDVFAITGFYLDEYRPKM